LEKKLPLFAANDLLPKINEVKMSCYNQRRLGIEIAETKNRGKVY
jgi:hypothetical protein